MIKKKLAKSEEIFIVIVSILKYKKFIQQLFFFCFVCNPIQYIIIIIIINTITLSYYSLNHSQCNKKNSHMPDEFSQNVNLSGGKKSYSLYVSDTISIKIVNFRFNMIRKECCVSFIRLLIFFFYRFVFFF